MSRSQGLSTDHWSQDQWRAEPWAPGDLPEERGGDELPATPGRAERRRTQEQPAVNPYAIVALVAALLGLFPVAVVFGLIAFSYRGGKTMAVFALLLGALEVTIAVALVLRAGHSWSDLTDTLRPHTVAAASSPDPVRLVLPSAAVSQVSTTPAVGHGLAPGDHCDTPRRIGIASDGATLVCDAAGAAWAPAGPVMAGAHEKGTACDPAAVGRQIGRTAAGVAVGCVGEGRRGTWQ